MNKTISVIVPVYNAESTIKQCVDSILSQKFRNFELLLIDDGSKDDSPFICDRYSAADNRVKVFHKQNGGVSSARNLGLEQAKGEWITFVDSDDYITEGYFESVIGSEEDLTIKGYQKLYDSLTTKSVSIDKELSFTSFVYTYFTNSLLRAPWAKFYKKRLIGDLRFKEDMKIGEDAWFVFNYLSKCKTFVVSDQGKYIVRVDDKPDEVKYAITVSYAVQSLQYLQEAFEGLVKVHGVDKSLFLAYIGYFKRISKVDWRSDKAKWYGNPQVKILYNYVWPSLSLKQKIRLIIARLMKK